MRHRWMCAPMIALCLLLPSCGGETGNAAEELALEIRGEYLSMAGCTARAELTADYGQRVYTYGLDISCTQEETVLTITEPENISGVTARIQAGETVLEYDGVRVETGALNRDGLSPMDAVPALLTAAKEGFLAQSVLEGSGEEAETLHITIRDPEIPAGSGTEFQLWFAADTHALVRGEISEDGATVIQCSFSGFTRSEGGGKDAPPAQPGEEEKL